MSLLTLLHDNTKETPQVAVKQNNVANLAYNASTTYSSLGVALAAPATAGNLIIASWIVDKASGTFTVPSGWTQIQQQSGVSVSIFVIYKIATGGETLVTATWATPAWGAAAIIAEFTGADTTTPIGPTSLPVYSDTAVTSKTFPSVTPTSTGMVIAILGIDTANTVNFNPTSVGYTQIAETNSGAAVGSGAPGNAMLRAATTANTAIAPTFTWTDSDQVNGVLITLNPLVVVTPVTYGLIKVDTGSAFVPKPVKVWTGSAWKQASMKMWNGTTWVMCNTSTTAIGGGGGGATNATLSITANGTFAVGWANEGTTDYTKLQTNDGGTTAIYSPTNGDVVSYALGDLPGTAATVTSVTVHNVMFKLDPVTCNSQAVVVVGGTQYTSPDMSPVSNVAYEDLSYTWTTNPATGAAWTVAAVNALEIGVKKTDTNGERCTQVYAVVAYS